MICICAEKYCDPDILDISVTAGWKRRYDLVFPGNRHFFTPDNLTCCHIRKNTGETNIIEGKVRVI